MTDDPRAPADRRRHPGDEVMSLGPWLATPEPVDTRARHGPDPRGGDALPFSSTRLARVHRPSAAAVRPRRRLDRPSRTGGARRRLRLGIPGVSFILGPAPSPPPAPTPAPTDAPLGAGLGLGAVVSLDEAAALVDFELPLPSDAAYGEPDAVWFNPGVGGGQVSLAWGAAAGRGQPTSTASARSSPPSPVCPAHR